ncbi:hypothetical protein M1E11_24430 (plasmid) [Bacillus sp. JZ8]
MKYSSYDEIEGIRRGLKEFGYQNWLQSDLFTWQWWILLIAAIFPWIIWGYLIKRENRLQVFAFAMLMGTISCVLDVIGTGMLWWGYPTKLIFTTPPLFPADLAVIPVAFSLAYYYGKTWPRYILYIIIVSFLFSYVIEPLFIWIDIYEQNKLPHWLSFIGFTLVSLLVRWILERMLPMRKR